MIRLPNYSITRLPDYPITRSPAALRDPCDVALERQLAEAEAAQRELPHVGARAAAQMAAVAQPDLELRRFLFLCDLCSRCHKPQFCLNGMPMNWSSLRASWSVLAVVTTDTFMPRALSTFM